MSEHGHHSKGGPERDFSDLDIPISTLLKFVLGLALLVVFTFWGAKHFLHSLTQQAADKDVPVSDFAQQQVVPPEPRLQVDEKRTLDEQIRIERETAETYGWIDKPNGVVRIPVERAMDLIAERGLPARQTK